MADIEIGGSTLIVHINGIDQLLALKTRIEVPLVHVAEVVANPPEAHGVYHGLRMGGTNLPGVVTAGRFLHHGEWAFWDVHDPDRTVLIRLHDEGYAKLLIGVDDPAATAAAITGALPH